MASTTSHSLLRVLLTTVLCIVIDSTWRQSVVSVQAFAVSRHVARHSPHTTALHVVSSSAAAAEDMQGQEYGDDEPQTPQPPPQRQQQIHDNDASLVEESFAELYKDLLPIWLLERLSDCGWTHPTLIQKAALDAILRDELDAVVQAQTGSGKTLSFLLPILANVDPSRAAVQAMIVVPTRELGLQVGRVAKRLAANSESSSSSDSDSNTSLVQESSDEDGEDNTGIETAVIPTSGKDKIMIMTVLQGSQNRRQRAWAWADPPQVVIGTPEELCNMVRLGGIKRYNSVKYLVVDEVDACLLNNAGTMKSNVSSSRLHELLSKYLSPTYDDGSNSDGTGDGSTGIDEIGTNMVRRGAAKVRPISKTRQTIFCSATIPQHRHFMKQCVQNQWILSKNPKHVCLRSGEQLVPPTLEHAYMVCASSEKKFAALRRILQKIYASASETSCKKVLVFAEPKRPLEEMAQVLANDLDGLLWKEVYGPEEEATASSIVGVLRFEDSLSQRAAALQGFTGETNGPVNSHQWKGRGSGNASRSIDPSETKDTMKMRILFSTDLAARGLDIMGITHVVQLDLASDPDSYVHRSGRSGRFGAEGQVVSIITPEQEFVLNRLANKLFLDMDCIGRQKTKNQKTAK